MELYTRYYNSPIGFLQLQCSETHLSKLIFCEGKTADEMEHAILDNCCTQLDEYFSGKRKSFDLPINQPGTEFQQKVWQLLMQIPFGKTVSYTELSKQFGNLKAIRAVASANGRNNISLIVPCHRVIGSNHTLVGYAGGLWRKKWLLEHEAKFQLGVQQLEF